MRLANVTPAAILLVGALWGCSVSSAERQEIEAAWAARDAERAAECRRNGGQFAAGGCVFRGP
jgi:hypothetical protein